MAMNERPKQWGLRANDTTYFSTDVLSEQLGAGFASLLGETKFERSKNALLCEDAIARISMPHKPELFNKKDAAHRISSLVYELTLKMEDQAASLHPNLLSVERAPELMAEAVTNFIYRIWDRHELYEPYVGQISPEGETYEVIINCMYTTASVPIEGVERMCFIYSASTCVWREKRSFVNMFRNLFGFTTRRQNPQRTFDHYVERVHTGINQLRQRR